MLSEKITIDLFSKVECCYSAVKHDSVVVTKTDYKSDFVLTTHTPQLALKGELCSVYCEHFGDFDHIITVLHIVDVR